MKSLQHQVMKTIKTTKYISIKLAVVSAAVIFVFSLTGFNSELDNETGAMIKAVVFEIEVIDYEHSPPKIESTMAIVSGNKLNMEIPPSGDGEGKGEMIFNGDKGKYGEVVLVDEKKNECYVMDDAFIEKMLQRVDESKSMMNEAMKNLTKEQRDMIEKMQKQEGVKIPGFNMTAPVRKVVNTGIRATKAGYPCVKYEVYLDGVKIGDFWITDWNNIEGGNEAKGAFRAMNKFFDKMKEQMGDLPGGNDFFDNINFEDGFPAVIIGYNEETGDLEDKSTLKNVKRQTVESDTFEKPINCNNKNMFGE